jgi:hypothetical protein
LQECEGSLKRLRYFARQGEYLFRRIGAAIDARFDELPKELVAKDESKRLHDDILNEVNQRIGTLMKAPQ